MDRRSVIKHAGIAGVLAAGAAPAVHAQAAIRWRLASSFPKALDTDLLLSLAQDHDLIVTVEEGCRMGGAGSAVMEALQEAGVVRPVLVLGLNDTFTEHGDPAHLLALQGLDATGIEAAVRQRLSTLTD